MNDDLITLLLLAFSIGLAYWLWHREDLVQAYRYVLNAPERGVLWIWGRWIDKHCN